MADPPKKKRKAILLAKHVQAREMAKRVLEMCVEEKRDKQLIISVKHGLDRAALYTGLSKKTLLKIEKEARLGIIRSTSEKGNLCNKKNSLQLNCSDRSVVYRCLEEFYTKQKKSPTCSSLLAAIRKKIEFPWKEQTLRKVLRIMGYKWSKCHNEQQILVEKPDISFQRSNYLRKMCEYRQINRNVYFLTETGIDSDLIFKKCWKNNSIHTGSTETGRVLLAYAGYRGSFLNGSKLIFEANSAVDDNQVQMNCAHFEKWITEILIPNLPPNSVVVLDMEAQAPVAVEELPTKTSTKTVMLEWLTKNHIEASFNMRKDELFNLVESNKPLEKTYKMDELILSYGHEVWRLPQFMCDLNPIELAWTHIRTVIREKLPKSDSPINKNLKDLIATAVNEVSVKDWHSYDKDIITLETSYWDKDSLMENILDTFDIDADAGDSDDSDSESLPTDINN